jgi:alginate O-acetyltransferase complex protein AlgI
MLFTSLYFLFFYLPLTAALYYAVPHAWRNAVLLIASCWFYLWGEPHLCGVLALSIGINYGFGRALQACCQSPQRSRWVLGAAAALNVGALLWYKYAAFAASSCNAVFMAWGLQPLRVPRAHLPVGISFYTFHALSYLTDVYRQKTAAQRSLPRFALYLLLFPQLVAGPIVRYHAICAQLGRRRIALEAVAAGCQRFVLGLAKKTLLANRFAQVADDVFALPSSQLSCALAWLGAVAYMLQIYFDFSGYSDMAIGLARLFGFEFPENFSAPYGSRSITEFWRRWHISLSAWFRDYVFIPLGGSRGSALQTHRNLLTVFILCGLWHGANWTFVVWGLFHGLLLVGEKSLGSSTLGRLPAGVQRAYTLLAVLFGWVLFRAESLGAALRHGLAMLGHPIAGGSVGESAQSSIFLFVDPWVLTLMAGAAVWTLFSASLINCLQSSWQRLASWLLGRRMLPGPLPCLLRWAGALAPACGLGSLFWVSAASLAAGAYNPFIYFRF